MPTEIFALSSCGPLCVSKGLLPFTRSALFTSVTITSSARLKAFHESIKLSGKSTGHLVRNLSITLATPSATAKSAEAWWPTRGEVVALFVALPKVRRLKVNSSKLLEAFQSAAVAKSSFRELREVELTCVFRRLNPPEFRHLAAYPLLSRLIVHVTRRDLDPVVVIDSSEEETTSAKPPTAPTTLLNVRGLALEGDLGKVQVLPFIKAFPLLKEVSLYNTERPPPIQSTGFSTYTYVGRRQVPFLTVRQILPALPSCLTRLGIRTHISPSDDRWANFARSDGIREGESFADVARLEIASRTDAAAMSPLDFDLARFTSLQHLSISGIPLGLRAFASFGANHPLRTLVLGPYTQPSASQLTPLLEGSTRPPSLQSIDIYPERWAYVGQPLTDDWEFLINPGVYPSYNTLLEFADRRSNAPGPRENGDASVYGVDASWRLPAWTPHLTFEGFFKLLDAAKAANVVLGGSIVGSIVVEWSFRRQVAALRKQLVGEMITPEERYIEVRMAAPEVLPPELYILIVASLPHEPSSPEHTDALLNFSLVNRAWRELSVAHLLACPTLATPRAVTLLCRTLRGNPSLSRHVKDLAVHLDGLAPRVDLATLLARTPRVRRLSVSRLGMATPFELAWLRYLPDLKHLALSVVRVSTPQDDDFQHPLEELSLRAVDFYPNNRHTATTLPPNQLTASSFPALSHLALRYLFKTTDQSSPLSPFGVIEPALNSLRSLTVYIGDSGSVTGLMRWRSASASSDRVAVLWDCDGEDMPMIQSSPFAEGWKMRSIRYCDTGTTPNELTAALEHNATALRAVRTIFFPSGWLPEQKSYRLTEEPKEDPRDKLRNRRPGDVQAA
ncbi:hypothetical protein RQP46_001108 [Phenoliferia psychrophenolica]